MANRKKGKRRQKRTARKRQQVVARVEQRYLILDREQPLLEVYFEEESQSGR